MSTVYAFLTIEEWCLNWTRLSSRVIVITHNLIQWFINNQSLCHIWNNCLVSNIGIHATMWNTVVLSSSRAWYALFSIKVEVWSWIEALDAFRSIIKWSGFIAWLISLWKLIESILLYCKWMLRYPVRSEDVRYISIFACVIRWIISNAGDTVSRIEIENSESWIVCWWTGNALLLNSTVKGCCWGAKILRLGLWHISNVLLCFSGCGVSGDTSF